MGIRIALALCAVAGSTMIGKTMAGSLKRRAALLAELAGGLKALRLHVVSLFEPIADSLSRSECRLLEMVGRQMAEVGGADAAWATVKAKVCAPGGMADALTASDEQLLDRLFSQLGQSGRESQEALISGILQSVEEAREAARARAAQADRLYVTLGLLTGLMLALVVI